ncbi:hypothetical protein ACCS67_34925, partial [Rhizobium brockwellii]|uniref:hypothetical protein n=1 Tax=Rhizobium brockwellii TaxID=3019932 RepID=UPI003F9BDBF3
GRCAGAACRRAAPSSKLRHGLTQVLPIASLRDGLTARSRSIRRQTSFAAMLGSPQLTGAEEITALGGWLNDISAKLAS